MSHVWLTVRGWGCVYSLFYLNDLSNETMVLAEDEGFGGVSGGLEFGI